MKYTGGNRQQIVGSGGNHSGLAGKGVDQQHAAVCLRRVPRISVSYAAERCPGKPDRFVVGGAAVDGEELVIGRRRLAGAKHNIPIGLDRSDASDAGCVRWRRGVDASSGGAGDDAKRQLLGLLGRLRLVDKPFADIDRLIWHSTDAPRTFQPLSITMSPSPS